MRRGKRNEKNTYEAITGGIYVNKRKKMTILAGLQECLSVTAIQDEQKYIQFNAKMIWNV